jgi:hypothetical protein
MDSDRPGSASSALTIRLLWEPKKLTVTSLL